MPRLTDSRCRGNCNSPLENRRFLSLEGRSIDRSTMACPSRKIDTWQINERLDDTRYISARFFPPSSLSLSLSLSRFSSASAASFVRVSNSIIFQSHLIKHAPINSYVSISRAELLEDSSLKLPPFVRNCKSKLAFGT